jgi:hypothetical protein
VLITNAGPNHAAAFAVTNILHPIISLVDATVTTGLFDTNSRRWSLPQLAVNGAAQVSLTVSPTNVGFVTNDFRLVAVGSIDTNTVNNSGALITAIFRNGSATYLEPVSYTNRTNGPWLGTILAGLTVLEDFEDGSLVSGALATTHQIFSPGAATDSVDADDGTADGSGTDGHSVYSSNAVAGITFTFNSNILGALPTSAGLVWTDGDGAVTFEGFGPTGKSLGTFGTFGTNGGSVRSANDLFFGVTNLPGISAIKMTGPSGVIEVDHLQFTVQPGVAIPMGLALWFDGNGSANSVAGTNTATLQNGATFGAGKVGQAFRFDGVNDFVQIANTATALPPVFTLEFWMNSSVNLNSQSGFVPFVVVLDPNDEFESVAKGFDFYYQNGALKFGMAQNTGGGSVPIRSIAIHTNDIASNRWHHVAGSLSNGIQRLFFDGSLVATQTMQGAVNYTPAPLLLGRALTAGGFTATGLTPAGGTSSSPAHFAGGLDEISFYDSVVDAAVIANIHRQGEVGKVVPLASIARGGGAVAVRWPVFQPNFDVQGASNIAPMPNWTGTGVTPVVSNGLFNVIVTPAGTAGFFRLENTSPSAQQAQP